MELGEATAVDGDGHTRHVVGLLGAEEGADGAEVVGIADPTGGLGGRQVSMIAGVEIGDCLLYTSPSPRDS